MTHSEYDQHMALILTGSEMSKVVKKACLEHEKECPICKEGMRILLDEKSSKPLDDEGADA